MALGRRSLGEHEEVLLDVRFHLLSLVRSLLVALVGVALAVAGILADSHEPHLLRLVLYGLLGISIVWVLLRFAGWRSRHLIVTTERLIVRSGLLRRFGTELVLRKIVSLQTHQRLFERVVRRGSIGIEMAGERASFVLEGVTHPLRVARTINAAIDAALGVQPGPERGAKSTVGEVLGRLQALYRSGLITTVELAERTAELNGPDGSG